jgi:hypothetical protein
MGVFKIITEYREEQSELEFGEDTLEIWHPWRSTVIADYKKKLHLKEAQLAEWLHDSYEEIAKGENWKTQESCKVKFDDLPEENKKTMLELAKKILNS